MIRLRQSSRQMQVTEIENDGRVCVERQRFRITPVRYLSAAILVLWPLGLLAEIEFYVGLGATTTQIETSGVLGALETVGLTADEEMDKTAFGGQIFAGAMFTRNLGVEVKYSDSGEADDTIVAADPVTSNTDPVEIEVSMDGFTAYGVATFPLPKLAEVSLKLGYVHQDVDVTIAQFGAPASASSDDDGLAAAAALRFRLGDHWAVTGELEYWAIDFDDSFDEPLRFSINGEYRF